MAERQLIRSYSFRGSDGGPHLLITAGVHGDEFESIAAVCRLRRWFEVEAPGTTWRGRVTLVPVVNESAFLRGQRTGDDGLDLARTCPGDPQGGLTQRVAAQLSHLIRAADYYIDLHTGGTEFTVLPLAGYTLHPDSSVRQAQRNMARAFNLPIVWGTAPNLDGRSLSVARDAGVPAIYAEYLGGGSCDSRGIDAYVDGCFNVMTHLGIVERTIPYSQVRHAVEDSRPDSGHLQICHPSPMTGLFMPAVQLGDTVRAGDPLGALDDLVSERPVEVRAEQSGIVLVLRSFPRVRQGESLAVILET